MQHARYECPSATLRRTLKRRSSSTYEASGCASVTPASSAFSVPVAAIRSSCKPALLCSDGCGAVAVHSVCGSRDPFSVGARGDGGFAPDRLIGHGHTDKSVSACTLRERACACGNCLLPERARQVAACTMRQETDGVYDVRHAS